MFAVGKPCSLHVKCSIQSYRTENKKLSFTWNRHRVIELTTIIRFRWFESLAACSKFRCSYNQAESAANSKASDQKLNSRRSVAGEVEHWIQFITQRPSVARFGRRWQWRGKGLHFSLCSWDHFPFPFIFPSFLNICFCRIAD